MELIKKKPVATYVVLKNNLKLIMVQSKHPFTDDQLDQALYGLINEIEVKEMKDLDEGEIN